MNKQIKASLLLLLTALIWGLAFVAQSSGMEYIGPFGFNAIRSLMGAMVVFPVPAFPAPLKHPLRKESASVLPDLR